MFADNENDLGKGIRKNAEYIEVEGELAAKIKMMMKLNAVLWTFCLASLSVTIIAVMHMPVTAGASAIASVAAGTATAAVLGTDAVISAVSISIAGGGVHTLRKLRKYRLRHTRNGGIVLYLRKKKNDGREGM